MNYAPPQPAQMMMPMGGGMYGGGGMYMPVNIPPPPGSGVVYMAGDPRIGGRVCGNCKGTGIRTSMMGFVEEQCQICRGIGRIL